MKPFSEFVIISDVDGTLLPPGRELVPRNIDAVRRFREAGGRFGLATGRSRESAQPLAEALEVNLPCVLYNGGVVYDYRTGEYISEEFLPGEAKRYALDFFEAFPSMQVLIISNSKNFRFNMEIQMAEFVQKRIKMGQMRTGLEELDADWYKVLFLVEEDIRRQVLDYTVGRPLDGIRFVFTNETLMEMLPAQASKAYGLEKLMDAEGVATEDLVAIGDYHNDLEMIKMAGIGAVTAGAPQDLRQIADLVVGDCRDGAVADLIEYLETHYPG